jgi:membrane-bound inhibitor of C-type lysozyme
MLKNLRKIAFICSFGALLFGCADRQKPVLLTVTVGEQIIYKSDNGDLINARYFSLSDRSLEFVKVTLPGGKEYTLPRVLSASGVKYTDDREIVWWTKGNTAFAEVRDENGQWIRKFNCQEMPGRK